MPTIQHNGERVSPAAGEPQDFSDPVDYSVIASDGSAHSYRVSVVSAPSSRKDIKGQTLIAKSARSTSNAARASLRFEFVRSIS